MNGNGNDRWDEQGRPAEDWVFRPLATLSTAARWVYVLLLTCMAATLSWYLQRRMESPFGVPDHEFYVSMAQGHGAAVPQPFASRPLAPLLARGLSALAHWPVQQGFVVLGWVSLLATLLVVFGLAGRSRAPRWLPLLMAVTPFWAELLHTLALPDLLAAALLCGFLLCLANDRPLWAALALCPLMVGRESTSLVLVCLLMVGWRPLRLPGRALAVGAVVAGAVIVRVVSAGGAGNTEHLPMAVYLAAKVPWNLLRLVGIEPWSNLYPFLCTAPAMQIRVRLGPLHGLGVCGVSPVPPMSAALALLTTFGVLPALVVLLWRATRRGRPLDLLTRFCLLYGGCSCVLAPLIGTAYSRLLGYAWPLFFVALPRLFAVAEGRLKAKGAEGNAKAAEAQEAALRAPDAEQAAAPRGAGARGTAYLALGGLLAVHLGLGTLAYLNPEPVLLVWGAVLEGVGVLLLSRARPRFLCAPEALGIASMAAKKSGQTGMS